SQFAPGWSSSFGTMERNRAHATNRNHCRLFTVFFDAVVMRRPGNPTHEAAGRGRHGVFGIKFIATANPPGSRYHHAVAVGFVPMWCTHVAWMPLDQSVVQSRL